MASVCWSLQYLISALTQAGGGGLLFRFPLVQVLLRGGRGAAGRYSYVWVALTVFRPHWVCPRSRVCVCVCAFPVYTAQAPGCSIWSGPCIACSSTFQVFHKGADSVGSAFCAFPGPSSSGCQKLDGRTLLSCGVPSPLRGPSLFPRAPVGCVHLVSVLGSWPLAANLLANVNHPESQEAFG